MARINTAMARIDAARPDGPADKDDAANSGRVMALVNAHEKLREEVADTIGELDTLIEELEG